MAPARTSPDTGRADVWPALSYEEWKDTYATLHMWTQVVGKIRFALTPWINHSWHVTLYVTARGLTTSPIPYDTRTFQIDFDFVDHRLVIQTNDGAVRGLELRPRSVADFYREVVAALNELGLEVPIHTTPNEVADPIPFEQDHTHASYDAERARRFWRILVQADRVSRRSAPALSASAPRSISFGAASIWRSPGFPGDRLLRIQAASPTFPTP